MDNDENRVKKDTKMNQQSKNSNFNDNSKKDTNSLSPFVYYKENAFPETKSRDIENLEDQPNEEQKDPRITIGVELIFMLIGTNVLFAYNTFINGLDFFETLFPTRDASTNIARGYNIAASLSYFISLPFIEQFHLVHRYYFSSIGIAVIMLFTMIYSNVGNPLYEVCLGAAICTGLFSGILFGTSMGYAGLFGANCSSMATSGLALGGLITSIMRVLSKLMGPAEGWFYFGICVLFNVGSVIAFTLFQRTELSKEKIQYSHVSNDFCERMSRIKEVFVKVYPFCLEAFLCMTITLTIFPGYASKIASKHGLSQSWVTTLVTSSYMVGDFLGRILTRWFSFPSGKYLWIPHLCRLIFFPIYILAVEGIAGEDDIWIYVVTLLLALTGGFWIGLCITDTAKDEKLEEEEVELAVFLTSLFLNIGIFVGSWLTYAMP